LQILTPEKRTGAMVRRAGERRWNGEKESEKMIWEIDIPRDVSKAKTQEKERGRLVLTGWTL